MPIYEYQCKACGEQFEVIQKITDEPLTQRPECEKKECEIEKLISSTSFILKGGGWYRDGYGNKKKGGKS